MPDAANTFDVVGCELVSDALRQFGEARVRVTGSSMLPSIFPGDILVVQRQDLNQFAEGDIALFSRSNRLFAHRVLRKNYGAQPYLVTCGDSAPKSDPAVFDEQLLGRVTTVVRGRLRMEPGRVTPLWRVLSILFRESDTFTRVVLSLLRRTRGLREGSPCQA